MRSVWTALAILALSNAATADECKIVWLDLFLPQSEAKFEKTSELSALLTLQNTTKLEPISFELAVKSYTDEDKAGVDLLFSEKTLVSGGLSNQVTVTLLPKTSSWRIGFDNEQTLRTKDGQTFTGDSFVSGYLTCNQLKPWPLGK